MARTAKRAVVRPTKTRAKKKAGGNGREPEVAQAPPDTRELLLVEFGKLCDDVDKQLADEAQKETASIQRPMRFFQEYPKGEPWTAFYNRRGDLTRRFRVLLEAEAVEDERVDVAQVLLGTLTLTDPGIVPTFGRPGSWVEWIGWSPLLVHWGGYAVPGVVAYAVDPDRPWMDRSGHDRLEVTIMSGETSPYQAVRRTLAYMTTATRYANRKGQEPSFEMVPLHRAARAETGARLSEAPWLQAALRRGPVNAIAMPKHIKSVQMALA